MGSQGKPSQAKQYLIWFAEGCLIWILKGLFAGLSLVLILVIVLGGNWMLDRLHSDYRLNIRFLGDHSRPAPAQP